MASLNKVLLIGNLGGDPEVRAITSGDKVANFNIATTERFTDRSGNQQEKTEWHRIVLWRKQAEIAERYLRKGSQVYIEGKLQTRSWDDQNGQKRYSTEVVADRFLMLGGRRDGGGGGGGYQGGNGGGGYQGGNQGGGNNYGGGNQGGGNNYGGGNQGGGNGGGQQADSMPSLPEDDLPF